MLPNKNKRKIKIQNSMEYIIILVVVAMIAIGIGVYLINSTHNVSVGTSDEIISAQASSSNTLILKLSDLLPPGAQIKGINFTGVPSGTPISVSFESQKPVYVNGYPEYSFSVSGLPNPLPYYNVSSLTYEVNGKIIAVPTITGEPMAIEETSLYSSNSNSFPKPTSIPSGIVAYVPITITNTQDISTQKPFQQMIQIQESQFSNYITYNGNIANFEFFTQSGSVLSAWIESNNSDTLTVWVNLLNGIPASSNTIIYLGFASTTTNLLSSSGTSGIGEAPQLSCPNPDSTANCQTYAEYDDGDSVFNFYDNFAGTSLNTNKWTVVTTGGSVTVNNGVTIQNSNLWGVGITSKIGVSPNSIFEAYRESQSIGAFGGGGIALFNTVAGAGYQYCGWYSSWLAYVPVGWQNEVEILFGSGTPLPSAPSVIGIAWLATGSEYTEIGSNGAFTHYTDTSVTISSLIYPGLGNSANGSGASQINYWARVRAYTPNGVMPSVSFGSIQ